MVDRRTPNEKLCDEVRHLLTHGFYAVDKDTGEVLEDTADTDVLAMTKPWRNDLWKKLHEVEDKLCPMRAKARQLRQKDKANADAN